MREDELLERLYTGGCSGLRNLNSRRLRAAAVYQSCRSAAENACDDALVFFFANGYGQGSSTVPTPKRELPCGKYFGGTFCTLVFQPIG